MSEPTWPSSSGDGDEQGGSPPPPPPPPPPPGAPAPPGAGTTADLGVRLGARLIDLVLLWIVGLVIIVPLVIGAMFADAAGVSPVDMRGGGAGFVGGLIGAAINIGYFTWLESSRGQTIGKQLLKIRVVGPGGGNPTVAQAFKRNLWLALVIIPIVGWLLQLAAAIVIMVQINRNPDRRGFHDTFADGTQVVPA